MKADDFMKQLERDPSYHLRRAKAQSERDAFLAKVELEQAPIVESLKKLGLKLYRLDDLFRRDLAGFSTEVGEVVLRALSVETTSQRTFSDCGRVLEKLPLNSNSVAGLIDLTQELYEKRLGDEIALGALVQAIAAHRELAAGEKIASLAALFGTGPLKKLLLEKRAKPSRLRARNKNQASGLFKMIKRWVRFS